MEKGNSVVIGRTLCRSNSIEKENSVVIEKALRGRNSFGKALQPNYYELQLITNHKTNKL